MFFIKISKVMEYQKYIEKEITHVISLGPLCSKQQHNTVQYSRKIDLGKVLFMLIITTDLCYR